jgi:hypothetical protein
MKRLTILVFTAIVTALAPSAPVLAAPNQSTVVQLRVEGESGTIFEGTVRTSGHNVTTPSGGTHHCDGTNNGANPTPGPTATSALDNGSRSSGFTFDGTFDTTFDDFLITRVGGNQQTATQFWGILLNGAFTPVGGCQQRVARGDEVLFAFDAFSKSHVLRLSGPATAKVGQPVLYHVIDRQSGAPIAGASVNGALSDASGNATLTFTAPTAVKVKANRSDSIRSNGVTTRVHA